MYKNVLINTHIGRVVNPAFYYSDANVEDHGRKGWKSVLPEGFQTVHGLMLHWLLSEKSEQYQRPKRKVRSQDSVEYDSRSEAGQVRGRLSASEKPVRGYLELSTWLGFRGRIFFTDR